jgi:hypothetical protein
MIVSSPFPLEPEEFSSFDSPMSTPISSWLEKGNRWHEASKTVQGGSHSLLPFQTVDLDFLFSKCSQLLFAGFHVGMDCLGRYSQVAHKRQDGDAVFSRKTVVSNVGGRNLGEDRFCAFR